MQDRSNQEKDIFLTLIDELFTYCLHHQITDLHLEASGKIRLRQNQTLIIYPHFNRKQSQQFRLRFKMLAGMDIHQERLPQDGHCQWIGPNGTLNFPCRISTCPTLEGEKMVVRLLDQKQLAVSWQTLGLTPWERQVIEHQANKDSGLIVINGPTGSGKTTTLYSLLEHLNHGQLNIISIEDPIEIPYLSFQQIELNPPLGFDLEACLRTVLRQDPDLIMIGEIRDQKTARLALNAVLSGHLVLTSLHAPSNMGVFDRLKHLGIHPHEILPYLNLLIAQRMTYQADTDQLKVDFDILAITAPVQQQIMKRF